MSGIADIQQPANLWLAECLVNFRQQLDDGIDPSFSMEIGGVIFELRLMECPGVFERKQITPQKGGV